MNASVELHGIIFDAALGRTQADLPAAIVERERHAYHDWLPAQTHCKGTDLIPRGEQRRSTDADLHVFRTASAWQLPGDGSQYQGM